MFKYMSGYAYASLKADEQFTTYENQEESDPS